MKILITHAALQTIGIVVLTLHAFTAEDHVSREQQAPMPSTAVSPPDMRDQHDGEPLLADEERLRRIVREELASLLAAQQVPQTIPAAAKRARNEAEDRRRQELIAQHIEAYRAVGTITDEQMRELQAAIATGCMAHELRARVNANHVSAETSPAQPHQRIHR